MKPKKAKPTLYWVPGCMVADGRVLHGARLARTAKEAKNHLTTSACGAKPVRVTVSVSREGGSQ